MREYRSARASGLIVLLGVLLGWALPGSALAATITVSTGLDEVSADGSCSLREAITAANTDSAPFAGAGECSAGSGADTVALPAGPFNLSRAGANEDVNATGDLDVLSSLTIAGAGAGATTIDANEIDRVLDVGPGRIVTVQGVMITGGRAPNGANGPNQTGSSGGGDGGPGTGGPGGNGGPGGGILNAGALTVVDSTISGNEAGAGGKGGNGQGGVGFSGLITGNGGDGTGGSGGDGGAGGGIYSRAVLTLTRTAVVGNLAGEGGAGGAGSGGQGGTAFDGGNGFGGDGGDGDGGAAGGGGAGGGVAEAEGGTLTVEQSSISGNTAGAGGSGGPGQGGAGGPSADIDGGVGGAGGVGTGANGGVGGGGGGISANDTLVATGNLIDGNAAGAGGRGGNGGGALGGPVTGAIGGAGDGGEGEAGNGGSGGSGGGVLAGSASSTNDAITGNVAGPGGGGGTGSGGQGGGVAQGGSAGNGGDGTGQSGGDGGSGGGLELVASSTIRHATIASNSLSPAGAAGPANAGPGGAAGVGGTPGSPGSASPGAPGSAGAGSGVDAAGPTTMQNSIVAINVGPSCSGMVADGGLNLSFPDAACPGVNADPKLAPLADNGGPTQTHALNTGSPAIDAVPASGAGCPASDQRGVSRPQGPACDIGAFERSVPLPGGGPDAFGAKTLVTLKLAARRIPAKGPLRVVVTNKNGFAVSGNLSGRTTKKVSVSRKRRIKLKGKSLSVAARAKKTVALKLPKALRRVLKRKRKLSLALTAKVKDPAGNTRTVKKTVKPKLKKKRKRTRRR